MICGGSVLVGINFDIPNGEIRQRPIYLMAISSTGPIKLGAVDIRLSPETDMLPAPSADNIRFIIIPS